MKRSEELKIKKTEKVKRMESLLNLTKGEKKRALTDEENTEFDNLKTEVENLNSEIERALFVEVNTPEPTAEPAGTPKNPGQAPQVKRAASVEYNTGKAIREFMRGGEHGLTGLEKETQAEFSRHISSNGILIPAHQRALTPQDTTTNASAINVQVDPSLSVFGKEPMWQKMGITVLPGLTGSVKLNKKDPAVAEKVAEKAAITQQGGTPTAVTLAPERFGISDLFDKELLVQENAAVQAAIVNDLLKGCDRKITAEVYAIALAAATEVAAGAITQAGFDALMAAVDGNGAFAMTRTSFFEAKGVKIDAGSGKFLVTLGNENGFGVTHDGAKAFYSTLFADGANQQYVLYGDWSEIWGGLWGAIEVLVNPYSNDSEGQVKLTVNKIADFACRNSAAFRKSPDLDAA